MLRFLAFLLLTLLLFITSLVTSFLFYPVKTFNFVRPYIFKESRDIVLKEYFLSAATIPSLQITGVSQKRSFDGILSATFSAKNNTVGIKIKDASFAQNAMLFQGLGLGGTLALSPDLHSDQPMKLHAESVTAGIELTNVSADLLLFAKTLYPALQNLNAHAFGGRISIQKLTFHPDTGYPQSMTVSLRKVDLNKLTSLLGQDDLSISGHVSGQIPIQMGSSGVTVTNGQIKAEQGGGIIQYQDDGQSSGLTGIVRKALSNYHYQNLEADITYTPDGQMVISARLKGFNPDLNKGQQVHVNLNVEQNVLSLLRSLRAKQNIEERIEQTFGKSTHE